MVRTTDPEQMTGDVIQLGTIASVDHANATCTVQIGEIESGDLPWLAQRAGGARHWSPPSIGEQCVVLSPEGDLANGLVVLGLYSNACPAPATDPAVTLIEYEDGAIIRYDHVAHQLSAILPAGGEADITAPGGITINGPVTINDDVTLNGKLTASDDVIADGKSLKGHRHGGVQAGTAQTGAPL